MIVINDDYRLLQNGQVKEGGLARNEAIITWLKKNKNVEEIQLNQDRFHNALTTLKVLYSTEEQTILLFYPTVGMPITKNGLFGRISAGLFYYALRASCRKNRIIIDICDLKYEQSIDLELDKERLKSICKEEEKLFHSQCDFIFASTSMKEYTISKYGITASRCDVLDNGSSLEFEETDFRVDEQKINLVYSGTLNRGRNIERMLNCVKGNKSAVLYLCGTGGEWIKETDNVRYLGALDEKKAHYIVSMCDIGLIPYDAERKYYNIAYPTKLSFYVTAGIPFLSTNVNEVMKIHQKYKIGHIGDIIEWSDMISQMDKKTIQIEKERIIDVRDDFTWGKKCQSCTIYSSL